MRPGLLLAMVFVAVMAAYFLVAPLIGTPGAYLVQVAVAVAVLLLAFWSRRRSATRGRHGNDHPRAP
ncbi:MAG: hypothetical protein FJ318_02915 [SAR202 cluster bacterium]|nr:hypothetical protein [SAR202 cluster bacterium]